MDLKCANCGEPWDAMDLMELLGETGYKTLTPDAEAILAGEGWKFAGSVYAVVHCPACKKTRQDIAEKTILRRMLVQALGDGSVEIFV